MDGMANLVEEIQKKGDQNLGLQGSDDDQGAAEVEGVVVDTAQQGTVNTLTDLGQWVENKNKDDSKIFTDEAEFRLLAIRSNPENIKNIPGNELTPEMIQAALELPDVRLNAMNEARKKVSLPLLEAQKYKDKAGPHAHVESSAEAFNKIVFPAIQKAGLSPEVLEAIKVTLTGSQGAPEDQIKTALENFENLKNQIDFGQAILGAVQLGAKEDNNQPAPVDEPAGTAPTTEANFGQQGPIAPPNQPRENPPGHEAPPTPGNPIGAPNINYVVDRAENPPSKPSTAAGHTNPDPSLEVPGETNETSNPTPEQPQASTGNEATKKEPEPLPDCPEGASDWLRGLHSALGDLKETHDVRLAQDRAKRGLTKQEQKKLEDEEEAKRQYQGGGGGGRSFLSFNRQKSTQKQDRRSSRKEELAQINDRLVQNSLRNTFTLSSQVEADRLALGEKMKVLNATLSNDPEAQKFLSKVDDFAAAKSMTRGDVFDKMHAGEMPGFAESARELAQRPDLRPLFADADALAGNLAKNTNSLCESLDSLKKKGVDVSHLKDHFERMENGVQDARIPDPASKQRLDKLNKAMQEQMRKIMEAITKLVQKVLNSIRGRFGG
jgi:hypothetical protein